jgi:transcriptional regulator with XRE-family HTH domain
MIRKSTRLAGVDGAENDPQATMVGMGILTARRREGLTLAELGQRTGLDKGYLSRVERGQKSPSIAALLKIAEALGVQVGHLLGERTTADAVRVVRQSEQIRIHGDAAGSIVNVILPATEQRRINAFIVEVGSNPQEKGVDHTGDEFIHVLRGTVLIRLRDRAIELTAGDSVCFDGHLRHHMTRQGSALAEVLIVIAQDLP